MKDDDYIDVYCTLYSDVLKSRAEGRGSAELEKVVSEIIDPLWDQVCRDALVGTYGEYTPALFPKNSPAFDRLTKTSQRAAFIRTAYDNSDLTRGEVRFSLLLQAKWFQSHRMGLQQLVHVLCGDIFYRATSELRGLVEVQGIHLGPLSDHFIAQYRSASHDIQRLRALFSLDQTSLRFAQGKRADLPLLAFSLKPRNGLEPNDFKRIALGVLRSGFNLVEADVRNVDFMDPTWRIVFGEIAQAALHIDTHVARFSMNISGPTDLALQYARDFHALHQGKEPWVVKVDGGLDGLSTIQALRHEFAGKQQPVITCYPIMGGPLASRIGPQTFMELLVLSGADIIYPGNAPRIGEGNFVDSARAQVGIERYRKILSQGWPMPSIAGGVHAGQLPVYCEIFGPQVAFFMGGGVALHRNGAFFDTNPIDNPGGEKRKRPVLGTPISLDQAVGGAELCRFAVEAIALTQEDSQLLAMLSDIQNEYVEMDPDGKASRKFQFEAPGAFLKKSKTRSFRDRS